MDVAQRTIGELVAEDYRRAGVFKRYGIDFCCGGGRTVEAACTKRGIALDEMAAALREAETVPSTEGLRPDTWELDFLADYIVNVHHRYVRERLPMLLEFTRKVARVHGDAQPETVRIAGLVEAVADEMAAHMAKEEQVLFPYIKALAAERRAGLRPGAPFFGTVRNPIRMMALEHEQAGGHLAEIRQLSDDFTPPEHACNTYRVAYAQLREFEEDLHRHVHLENNILFPRAISLEEAPEA
jgi:regulator of cell morphogenesis and NO signaling